MRKKKIELIGENNVQVTFTTKFMHLNDAYVETWDVEHTKSY